MLDFFIQTGKWGKWFYLLHGNNIEPIDELTSKPCNPYRMECNFFPYLTSMHILRNRLLSNETIIPRPVDISLPFSWIDFSCFHCAPVCFLFFMPVGPAGSRSVRLGVDTTEGKYRFLRTDCPLVPNGRVSLLRCNFIKREMDGKLARNKMSKM